MSSEQSATGQPDWVNWLDNQRARTTMSVEPASLETLEGWGALEDAEIGKFFGRKDGKFFRLVGAVVKAAREVAGWNQPLVEELGSNGVVVLLCDEYSCVLQATAEPGNDPDDAYTLLRATLQASRSNLEQAHGGKKPPRAELAAEVQEDTWVVAQQDGGRFLNKRDALGIVFLEGTGVEAWIQEHGGYLPNERRFTWEELAQAVIAGECNAHLRETLGAFWAFIEIAEQGPEE